ncbi:MAG TPA: aspartate aminotransferase family protein [Candidatus Eremiobacteraceae bacterium]|nr:aspartate aminotransferase family protein [Candidatus Eremiobacteraceae bacterium]
MNAVRQTAASHVFYRKLNREMPVIVRGQGVYLYDASGKRYLDACGGAMVASVGHGVKEIADAIGAQAAALEYVNGTMFSNEPVERLADALIERAPRGIEKAYFLSSGSEAVEAALKLARQYHVERGEPSRRIIIARTPGYHGNTLLALSASARPHYRQLFEPWLVDVRMIDAPYPYRAGELGARSKAMTGAALEDAIKNAGPENVAAFIAEPIGGSSTGAAVPPPEYYARVREICDRYGVLFIADEVLCGMGRTGKFFALEHFKDAGGATISPDIMTLGKGLNGGYVPLSAMLTRASLFEAMKKSTFGGLMHAQTYSQHPVAAAAGLATLAYIDKHRLVERAATVGEKLQSRLATLANEGNGAEIVGDVRGIGMLAAVELVADRATKRPFARELKVAERLVQAGLGHGIVLWPNTGHADGTSGDLVLIAPPLTIAEEEIEHLVELLRGSLADVARDLAAKAR